MKYVVTKKLEGTTFYIKRINFAEREMAIEPTPDQAKHFDSEEAAKKYCLDQNVVVGRDGFSIEPYNPAPASVPQEPTEDISVAAQYRFFLELMKLNEDSMHPTQREQLKQAFYGAWGQCLHQQQTVIAELQEDMAVMLLQLQDQEVKNYWREEGERYKLQAMMQKGGAQA